MHKHTSRGGWKVNANQEDDEGELLEEVRQIQQGQAGSDLGKHGGYRDGISDDMRQAHGFVSMPDRWLLHAPQALGWSRMERVRKLCLHLQRCHSLLQCSCIRLASFPY